MADNTINTEGGRPVGKVQLFSRAVFDTEILWSICGGVGGCGVGLMVMDDGLKIPDNDSFSFSASVIVLLSVFSNIRARFNGFHPRLAIAVWLLRDRANERSRA